MFTSWHPREKEWIITPMKFLSVAEAKARGGAWGSGFYSALHTLNSARPGNGVSTFRDYESAYKAVELTFKNARKYFGPNKSNWPDWLDEKRWYIVPLEEAD